MGICSPGVHRGDDSAPMQNLTLGCLEEAGGLIRKAVMVDPAPAISKRCPQEINIRYIILAKRIETTELSLS